MSFVEFAKGFASGYSAMNCCLEANEYLNQNRYFNSYFRMFFSEVGLLRKIWKLSAELGDQTFFASQIADSIHQIGVRKYTKLSCAVVLIHGACSLISRVEGDSSTKIRLDRTVCKIVPGILMVAKVALSVLDYQRGKKIKAITCLSIMATTYLLQKQKDPLSLVHNKAMPPIMKITAAIYGDWWKRIQTAAELAWWMLGTRRN